MAMPVRSTTVPRATTPAVPRPEVSNAASAHRALRITGKVAGGVGVVLLVIVAGLATLLMQPYWPMFAGLLVIAGAIALGALLSKRFAVLIAILALALTGVVTFSQGSAATPPITDAQGRVIPGSIAEMRTVNLGGMDQWIMIRGRSTTNPVLLYLSGGPGGTAYAWNREYNSALENNFVMVNWEQRGAGKSAGVLIADYAHMTPHQYTADGLQLTSYLRQRFHQTKIYLVGQSWGTMLGVWMVQQHPDWFAAYIGIGQMVNPVATDRLIYDHVLSGARASGNTSLVNTLESNGPPPYHGIWNAPKYTDIFNPNDQEMRALVAKSGPPAGPALVGMTGAPEYGLADQVTAQLGLAATFAIVYDLLGNVDLSTQALNLGVPIYFAEGRYDQNSTPALAVDYMNALTAPSKQVIWFEHSGHDPAHDEPAAFNDFMVNTVLAQR